MPTCKTGLILTAVLLPSVVLSVGLPMGDHAAKSYPSLQAQQQDKPFRAYIGNDCAPWDGAAFTILISTTDQIPQATAPAIHISIWQPPEQAATQQFTFPQESGARGTAYWQISPGNIEFLSGTVSFGADVSQGTFDFYTTSGQHFQGTFHADWLKHQPFCG